ncbi:MAG: alpha/beta hydrolase [Candidatus Thiodiazotropha sp. (ex Epidulcina cf. delphinae)]|nr:alpha/beta hydrolase [Candidatus Thiodiazotropha sp. (ex Epidulcina cf. delphinae)]
MYGLHKVELMGEGYTHAVFSNGKQSALSTLHVYLGGDGTPWIGEYRIARDPTPRNPLALALMASDETPSIYLGRPCYHGESDSEICTPAMWTSARYSAEVIESMELVLRNIVDDYGYSELVFIGFSGGGGLAMFLARRFPQTHAVVTLAGNLDIQAWAGHHDYYPLDASLNPKSIPPLPQKIRQYHLAGAEDKNIPPGIIQGALENQSNGQFIVFEGFTHTCCWKSVWQDILACVGKGCEWLEGHPQ